MKNPDGFRRRLIAFAAVVVLVLLIFIGRLVVLQLFQGAEHSAEASRLLAGALGNWIVIR